MMIGAANAPALGEGTTEWQASMSGGWRLGSLVSDC